MGTYHYWSTPVDQAGLIALRGVIAVVDAQAETWTVQARLNSFAAQFCTFPFIFNGINYTSCTLDDDTQLWCSPSLIYIGQRLYCTPTGKRWFVIRSISICSLGSLPTSSCGSSSLLNPNACAQTIPLGDPLKFLFTPCAVGSVTSVTPNVGPAGTIITINGTGFSSTACENDVHIESSYRCPIIGSTTTQLLCQISNGSMLNPKSSALIRVSRDRQGYLINHGRFDFQFQGSIFSISPTTGKIFTIIYADGLVSFSSIQVLSSAALK